MATGGDGVEAGPTAGPAVYSVSPKYLDEALEDAERLLKYAAESGVTVDAATRDGVLKARSAQAGGWTEAAAANLLGALATLAAMTRPVTAASLKSSADDSLPAMRGYLKWAITLAALILPFSIASLLATSISTALRADITIANDLAVKLQDQVGYPTDQKLTTTALSPCTPQMQEANSETHDLPATVKRIDVIQELTTYASTIRSIDALSRQLKYLVPHTDKDICAGHRRDEKYLHEVFQLPPGVKNPAQAAQDKTSLYQDVRYYAQNLLDDEQFFYGALTTCVLPVLYALLGTCAYLLRNFEQQMNLRTYMPSQAHSARFIIAGIGGLVVGLFNNFMNTQALSLSPLALAFLIGYAVDVFFAFLEGILVSFTRSASTPPVAK